MGYVCVDSFGELMLWVGLFGCEICGRWGGNLVGW